MDDLKRTLRSMDEEKRTSAIEEKWLGIFTDHIKPELDKFDASLSKAKLASEYLSVLKDARKFAVNKYDSHYRLTSAAAMAFQDKRISNLKLLGALDTSRDKIIDNLARDIEHGKKLGLWTEQEAIDKLKQHSPLYGYLASHFHSKCKEHHLSEIRAAVAKITKNIPVQKDNIEFTRVKPYLEHHMKDDNINHYLHNTGVTRYLEAAHKREELRKQQELELSKAKGMEYGM